MARDTLTELIADHLLAVRAFRHASNGDLGAVSADEAFEAEGLAMMALLSYPPETIEEARRRAAYLMATRFPHCLDAEGFAYLRSFITERGAKESAER